MRPLLTRTTVNPSIALSLLILLTHAVLAEIIELDILIDASSDEVHFVRGYLQAPASIDLSGVRFITTKEPEFLYGDDEIGIADDEFNDEDGDDNLPDDANGGDDDVDVPAAETEPPTTAPTSGEIPVGTERPAANPTAAPAPPTPVPAGEGDDETGASLTTDAPVPSDTDSPTHAPANDAPTHAPKDDKGTASPSVGDGGDGGGGERALVRRLEQGAPATSQIMDIALFQVPIDCKKDVWGTCDWATLGVGAYDGEMEGGMNYCCSADAASRGVCDEAHIGTLMVDHETFRGDHRKIEVPDTPDVEFFMPDPAFSITESGDYVMVVANCNDYGLQVLALGNMEWKSVGGYLPGDMFGLMFFYAAISCIYFVLALWYYCGMKMYQDAAIPIQRYIFATMLLGLFEVSFRGIDLYVWNLKGLRSDGIMYTALVLGVLKLASSRCLGVMVAMGWGVVRDTLGTALIKIIFLGVLYAGLTLARDFLVVEANELEKVSITEEEELADLALVLTPIIITVNLIFYFWIIASLNSTTEYLRNMNQTSKLRRHMRLRCLIITSLLVVGIWLVLSVVQVFTNFLSLDQLWIMEAVMHANYLFILIGVAVLWRPTSTSRDYAMQMEVPSLGSDDNELELSCVVPSADDMDYDKDGTDYDNGNDPDHRNGIRINDAVAS